MIWFCIFIPIIACGILLWFFKGEATWYELLLLLVPSALLILALNCCFVLSRTADTEYVGAYITKVIYYQAWDERVSCRHPIYCARSCGKNCTTTYVCGHVHSYDVDYHPEHWTKQDNTGSEYDISRFEFNKLQAQFNTQPYFVDLKRNYHSVDGDAYYTNWDNKPASCDVLSFDHSYTNKIKCSHSIFKFEDIDEKEKANWHLFDYPAIKNMVQPVVLGEPVTPTAQRKFQYLNGWYGVNKQFRLFVLIFKNQSMETAYKQRSYWEGGNKNEFVICLGSDSLNRLQWCKCFSWMDKPELEVEVQNYFKTNGKFIDYNKLADWLPMQIENHWQRKNFKDFDYLQVEISETGMYTILILVGLYNIIVSIWVVRNEIRPIKSE